jgi:hypothetical protein
MNMKIFSNLLKQNYIVRIINHYKNREYLFLEKCKKSQVSNTNRPHVKSNKHNPIEYK